MRRKVLLKAGTLCLAAAIMCAVSVFGGCGGKDYTGLIDHTLEIPEGREIRILQLTDTQIIDAAQARSSDRLSSSEKAKWATDMVDEQCYKFIRDAVTRAEPDLILLTGDLVYGEFDDAGTALQGLIGYMDSFAIPWAPVFGNHDNESRKGVEWQCDRLEESEYCLFERGSCAVGNGNYCVGILQGGELVRTVFLMDSNGCGNAEDPLVRKTGGFADEQKEWLRNTAAAIEEESGHAVPAFLAFHIPVTEFRLAAQNAGYESEGEEGKLYMIGEDVEAVNGDFGRKGENFKDIHDEPGLMEILQEHSFDGVFAGHSHRLNTSVLYEGIRWTFGLKTGTYDRYNPRDLGGTLITVAAGGATFGVEHLYYGD